MLVGVCPIHNRIIGNGSGGIFTNDHAPRANKLRALASRSFGLREGLSQPLDELYVPRM